MAEKLKSHGWDIITVDIQWYEPNAQGLAYRKDAALILDTHAEAVRDEVYDLLRFTLRKTGSVPVLLERDDNFPPWEELCSEIAKLDAILRASTAPREGAP